MNLHQQSNNGGNGNTDEKGRRGRIVFKQAERQRQKQNQPHYEEKITQNGNNITDFHYPLPISFLTFPD